MLAHSGNSKLKGQKRKTSNRQQEEILEISLCNARQVALGGYHTDQRINVDVSLKYNSVNMSDRQNFIKTEQEFFCFSRAIFFLGGSDT